MKQSLIKKVSYKIGFIKNSKFIITILYENNKNYIFVYNLMCSV